MLKTKKVVNICASVTVVDTVVVLPLPLALLSLVPPSDSSLILTGVMSAWQCSHSANIYRFSIVDSTEYTMDDGCQ